MSEIQAYLVPFSHMDLFWLGAREECLSRGNRVISEAMAMADKHPEFRFLIEDLVFINHFLQCHPEKKDRLKALLKDGQIEIGPKWAGIDQTPQIGEDLVRNSLYPLMYLEKELDYTPKTIHTGDLPGWTTQYPQILDKLGIPYAVYTRTGPTDVSLFYWVGLDGTKTLVWYSLNGYTWAWNRGGLEISVEKAMENGLERTMQEILKQGVSPIFVHWGVDLILPGKKLPENLAEWNQKSHIQMAFATPTEFFEHAPRENLKEIAGEVPSAWPYTDPQYLHSIMLSMPAVCALLNGEKFSAIAWQKDPSGAYQSEKIKDAWLHVLEAMDHNNNGQGYDLTRERKRGYLESAIITGNELTETALRRIAENVVIPFGIDCYPVVVFNPMSWVRTDVANVHVTFHGDIVAFHTDKYRKIKMVDEHGNDVVFQQMAIREGVAREEYIRFMAKDVPGCGYKTYYILPCDTSPEPAAVCSNEGLTFETPFHRIVCDEVTGRVTIEDRESQQSIVDSMYIVGIEEVLTNGSFRDESTGRRVESMLESVTLVDNGSVSATLKLESSIAETRIVQELTFYADSRRIDIVNDVDFRKWRPMRLTQVFDTAMDKPEVVYGTPYGVSWMDNVMPNCAPHRRDEMPYESWRKLRNCIKWVDLAENGKGITIASQHRCFTIDNGEIGGVMIRPVVSTQCCHIRDGKRVNHTRPYPGRFRFYYSLLPHEQDWAGAKSYRTGWAANYPLIPVSVGDAFTPKSLPSSDQLIRLSSDTDSLVLTVFKQSEDGEDLIARFYETEGREGTAKLEIPGREGSSMWKSNLREDAIEEQAIDGTVQYKPYEIVTMRIKARG